MESRKPKPISRREMLRLGASVAGVTAFGSLLAACGTTETPATSQASGAASGAASDGASASASAATTPTPTPAVLGTGSQRLVFWHGLGGADGATMVQMLGQYAQEKPELTISSETYDWAIFYQKLPTATAAGTPPALGIMHSWAIQQFATQGILQDAETLFFGQGLVPKDDFTPTLIEEISVDGKAQGVPFDYHGWINWVNTKVIQDAGLDPNNLPKNGQEFIEFAQKVTVDENGKRPNEDGFDAERVKVWACHSSWLRFTMPSTIWQFGGDTISADGTQSLLNDPKTVAAVQYWSDLITQQRVVPPAVPGVATPPDLFKSNSIALMWDGTWNLNFFKDNPDSAAVMKPMYINSLAPDGKQAVRFDSHMLIVPTGVEDPDLQAAKDLIVWLSNNGETWATSGQVPARRSVQGKQSVQDIESVKVAGQQFQEIGRPGQTHPSINEIVTTYEAAFSAVLSGTTPAQQAMDEAHATVQSILDRG